MSDSRKHHHRAEKPAKLQRQDASRHVREPTTYPKEEKEKPHHRHSDISIFNQVEVKVEPQPSPKIEVQQHATTNEDGDSVADCFKAIFSCCKK